MVKLLPEGRWVRASCTQATQRLQPLPLHWYCCMSSGPRSSLWEVQNSIPIQNRNCGYFLSISKFLISFGFSRQSFPGCPGTHSEDQACPWTHICLPLPVLELKACATMPSPYLDFKNSCWCWLHYMGRSWASGSRGDPVGGEHCDAAAQWDHSCRRPGSGEQTTHRPAASPRCP